jgi:hypothetical protein
MLISSLFLRELNHPGKSKNPTDAIPKYVAVLVSKLISLNYKPKNYLLI